MHEKSPEDLKYGSKLKCFNYFCNMPPKGRLISLLKILFLFVFFWLCLYLYLTTYKLDLIKQFQKEDLDIKKLQEKLSNIVQRNFYNGDQQEHEYPVKDDNQKQLNKKPDKEMVVEMDDGLTDEAKRFIKEFSLTNPGENGEPVELPKNLSDNIQKRIKEGYEIQGYNAFVSSMVSLNRNIPDVRSDYCINQTYSKNLPKCSIVIPFHNEDWMLLMRTVHSVMNRSPPELIEEILLVDDASDREYLQKPMDEYIKKYPKIKVIRSHRRLGIISNRMMGAVNAVGPIIIYIDSHVEVGPYWLEPLLDRFTKDMNILVVPKMSSIDSKNLKVWIDKESAGGIGGFSWGMDFNWIDIKWYEGDHPTGKWEPKRTPTIIGALNAISKDFFMRLGMFDPDFDIWGGEDVELSFKVWLCGGKVEYIPCSFAAHMYKDHKYTWPKSEKGGYRWNTDRIAEVWLDDDYKKYYYRTVGDTKDRKYGDISERLAIRDRLKCKPFKWFVENIYPMVPIPDAIKDPTTTTTEKPKEKPKQENPKNGTN